MRIRELGRIYIGLVDPAGIKEEHYHCLRLSALIAIQYMQVNYIEWYCINWNEFWELDALTTML